MTRPRPARPRTPAPPPARALPGWQRSAARVALASLVTLTACGAASDEPSAVVPITAEAGPTVADQRAAQARARVDALVADPSPTTLLAVLAQSHADARALLGPHHLRYKASFTVTPEYPARPVVGEPIQSEQKVVDDLVLAWGSAPGEPVRMHLSQQTDKGEGREVIILDEQVYTRLAHRGWHTRPLDSELHNLWLDEAQHCVHDLVELAAPALAVRVQESGDTLEVALERAEAVDAARVAGGHGREWRLRAEITEVRGSIKLARATGLWLAAELTVRHTLKDTLDRPQRGETQLTASVTPAPAAEVVIEAPAAAAPAPERVRPELERQRLLGGLAGS